MKRVRFRDASTYASASALANRVPIGGPTLAPSPASASSASANAAMLADVTSLTKELEREALLEQMTDILEQSSEIEREARREHSRIAAPTARAGYLVAIVLALLVFFFITQYVFAGNKVLTGALIVATALFFLLSLRTALERRGAGTIGSTALLLTSV